MTEVATDLRHQNMGGAWDGLVSPDEQYRTSGLFHDVQVKRDLVFDGDLDDSKTFTDCKPKVSPAAIDEAYMRASQDPAFQQNPDALKNFVDEHFDMPRFAGANYQPEPTWDRARHMYEVWDALTYKVTENIGSLALLPKPYIKAGGRYREFYGQHDAAAAAIGLAAHGKYDIIRDMVDNSAFMQQETAKLRGDGLGFVPNANRSYYLDRSQRPGLFTMVDILADHDGRKETLHRYLPALKQEFAYWTAGADEVNEHNPASRGMVYLPMPDGSAVRMGRYWSDGNTPRPEGYVEDIETGIKAGLEGQPEKLAKMYRDIRAAAASGKDFCGIWCEDGKNLQTVNTTDYVAVDLNCLLKGMSDLLSEALLNEGEHDEAQRVAQFGADIERGLNEYCLDEQAGWYFNYDFVKGRRQEVWALDGGGYPMFFGLSRPDMSPDISRNMRTRFLEKGGFLETLDGNPNNNWGGSNLWMLDNYMAIGGLWRRGNGAERALAQEVTGRVTAMADRVYASMGITPEKYNGVYADRPGGGGEYKVQKDGFPLNNGPLLGIEYGFYKEGVPQALGRAARLTSERAKAGGAAGS